ncbi:hypothetical protein Tco_0355135 [Tanacetum coccineum]
MADDRPMAEQLQAPTGGFESAIVVPIINAQNFELKSSLINLVQNRIFRGGNDEEPHAHIRHFESITNNQRYPDVPNTTIKLLTQPFPNLKGETEVTKDKVLPSTKDIQPPVIQKSHDPVKPVSSPISPEPSSAQVDNSPPSKESSKETRLPYPSRVEREKKDSNDKVQIQKFWEMFKKIHVDITLADAFDLVSKDGLERIVFKPDGSQDNESIHMMDVYDDRFKDVCEPESNDDSTTSAIVDEFESLLRNNYTQKRT